MPALVGSAGRKPARRPAAAPRLLGHAGWRSAAVLRCGGGLARRGCGWSAAASRGIDRRRALSNFNAGTKGARRAFEVGSSSRRSPSSQPNEASDAALQYEYLWYRPGRLVADARHERTAHGFGSVPMCRMHPKAARCGSSVQPRHPADVRVCAAYVRVCVRSLGQRRSVSDPPIARRLELRSSHAGCLRPPMRIDRERRAPDDTGGPRRYRDSRLPLWLRGVRAIGISIGISVGCGYNSTAQSNYYIRVCHTTFSRTRYDSPKARPRPTRAT